MWETRTITSRAQVPIVEGGDGPTLLSNSDPINTFYLSDDYGVVAGGANSIALSPGSWVAVDGETTLYAVTQQGQTAQVLVIPGGTGFFQLVTLIIKSIILDASRGNGLFEYLGTGALGNGPILWAVPPGTTTDPFGNTLPVSGGIATEVFGGGLLVQMYNGSIFFNDTLDPVGLNAAVIQIIHRTVGTANPILALNSPAGDGATDSHTALWLEGAPTAGPGTGLQTWFFAQSGSSFVHNFIGLVKGVLGFANFTGGPPVPALLGPAFIDNGNSGMVLIINANLALPTPVTNALLEIQGVLALTNITVPPASTSGASQEFSSSAGNRQVVAGDTNQYSTQTLYVATGGQIVSDVTPISNNIGPAINVGAGTYKIRITGIINSAVAAGIARVLFTGTATQTGWFWTKCTPVNGAPSFDGTQNASLFSALQIANPLAVSNYTFQLEGEFTVTVAGDIQFQGNTSAAADPWTWLNGTIELSPTG